MTINEGEKLLIARELAITAHKALDQSMSKLSQLGLSPHGRDELDNIAACLERAARWIYAYGKDE